jgi:hypothetical protein
MGLPTGLTTINVFFVRVYILLLMCEKGIRSDDFENRYCPSVLVLSGMHIPPMIYSEKDSLDSDERSLANSYHDSRRQLLRRLQEFFEACVPRMFPALRLSLLAKATNDAKASLLFVISYMCCR